MSKDLNKLLDLLREEGELAKSLQEKVEERRKSFKDQITSLDFQGIREEHLDSFAEKPYIMLPKRKDEYWVIVPRFVPFQIGWLERQTEGWNVFVVNKYVDWITPLPGEIKSRVGITDGYDKAIVEEGLLEVEPEERDEIWEKHRKHFVRREDEDRIRIKKGKEFDLIAELIDQGNLPFPRRPLEKDDIRDGMSEIGLRDYQERAWEMFKETGMIGVFWPPKGGKTFLGLYIGDKIDGKKLVVVPTNTLKEQWRNRIRKYCDPSEWRVETYHSYHKIREESFKLTIFDECQRLPAPTFSRMATIDTKYRMGLSATPFREDGKSEYIFALSGFPIGLRWQELMRLGVVEEPDVRVYLYRTKNQKRKDLKNLVREVGKILIFCDSIEEGKDISEELEVPFVYGQTKNRMEILSENRIVVGSRVTDEGLSLPNIDLTIEYDFLYGSRRQEAQRAGRVMHGEESKGEHIVMMTDDEYKRHEKRLFGLEEQGLRIRIERRK